MKNIISLILFIVFVYVAVSIAIPWTKFFIFKTSVFKVINISKTISNREIVKHIKEKAEELNIKLEKDSIQIEEYEDGNMFIVKYKSVVTFPFIENKIIFKHEFSRFREKKE